MIEWSLIDDFASMLFPNPHLLTGLVLKDLEIISLISI